MQFQQCTISLPKWVQNRHQAPHSSPDCKVSGKCHDIETRAMHLDEAERALNSIESLLAQFERTLAWGQHTAVARDTGTIIGIFKSTSNTDEAETSGESLCRRKKQTASLGTLKHTQNTHTLTHRPRATEQ